MQRTQAAWSRVPISTMSINLPAQLALSPVPTVSVQLPIAPAAIDHLILISELSGRAGLVSLSVLTALTLTLLPPNTNV